MPPIDHTFEIAGGCFPDRTKVQMYQPEHSQEKSHDLMKQIGKPQTAPSEYIRDDGFGE